MNSVEVKHIQKRINRYRIVGKLGSESLFTVLPKQLVEKLKIEQGDLLKIHQDSGKIIIEKVED